MSPSVGLRSPTRSDSSDSPVRGRRSPPRGRNTPSRKERSSVSARHRTSPKAKARSPVRPSSSHRDREKEKPVSRVGRSPPKRQISSTSPASESPSPATKRLKRAQSERVVDKGSDRERSRNSSWVGDKERHKREGEKERHSREGDKERQKREGKKEKHHREGDKERHYSLEGDTERHHSCEGDKERHNRDDLIDRRERSDRDKQDGVSSKSRHRRSESPPARGNINRHNSNLPSRVSKGGARDEVINPSGDEHPDENDSLARMKAAAESLEEKQKQKPSFELSGKLADETNRVRGVTLLFTEPSDARKPDVRWRLYVFKAGEALNEPLYIHRQSCYLFGRERRVADIPTDHPSCSKQHAVIQFRQVDVEKPDGMLSKQVRPYVMDLGSTNGTFLNDSRIDPQRYYELFEKDTLKFGNSSREYVILHENSA